MSRSLPKHGMIMGFLWFPFFALRVSFIMPLFTFDKVILPFTAICVISASSDSCFCHKPFRFSSRAIQLLHHSLRCLRLSLHRWYWYIEYDIFVRLCERLSLGCHHSIVPNHTWRKIKKTQEEGPGPRWREQVTCFIPLAGYSFGGSRCHLPYRCDVPIVDYHSFQRDVDVQLYHKSTILNHVE